MDAFRDLKDIEEYLDTESHHQSEGIEAALQRNGLQRKTVDEWLNDVDYQNLNSGTYIPSTFALKYMNFIKLVNGGQGEENKTPVVHLVMLDLMTGKRANIANLCHRGLGKTTLFIEYLNPFLACFRHIDGFGELDSMIYVSDSMDNGVKSARKNIEFRCDQSEFIQEWLPERKFTDNYIEMRNRDGKLFGMKMFGAKTGLRGTKIFGKRPHLCVLDDLVSDDDAKSKAALEAIRDTISKGVDYALHPTRRKTVFNGTPFNKGDPLYTSVESGAWHVNVWPVCERFPCKREEFHSSWPDRFTYEYVLDQYNKSLLEGKLDAFYQELMLRITSEEDRLVQDGEIRYYSRASLLKNFGKFNYYITTDFATSGKQSSDFSVISVWAYNAQGDWFWVDGVCEKQTMDKNINDLFRLVQKYKPQSVGIEVSGQQNAFITWIQEQMMVRNIWFNFASDKHGNPGIRPVADKLTRFNGVVPLFKSGKIYFPSEMKGTPIIGEFVQEIKLTTKSGMKSKHDDAIDTISMLMYLNPWKPSEEAPAKEEDGNVFGFGAGEFAGDEPSISSYIV